jgi:hypothetical protein
MPMLASEPPTGQSLRLRREPRAWPLQAGGLLLFLFIPLVLYLFVRHPAPIGWSLLAGLVLMAAHRLVARPYMRWVLPYKCVWCNRLLPPALDSRSRTVDLALAGEVAPARCCAAHQRPAARFFRTLDLARWPLRAGIFLPLLLLLGALAAAAAGQPRFLVTATALFQLVVGATVSLAAWGWLLVPAPRSAAPIRVPFPAHNFFLIGLRLLVWIFRLVGAWWIVRGIEVLRA